TEGHTPGLVLSMDLVGHGELTANGLGPRWGDDSLRWLMVTLGDPPVSVPFVYRALSRGMPSMERSDHRPFTEAGVRSLHLMGRGPDGLYWRYHTGLDDMDQVEPAAMARTLDAVLRLARAPVPGEDGGEPAFAARGAVVPGAVTLGAMGLGALMGLSALFGRLKATALGAAMGVVRALGLGLVWTLVLAVGSLGASTLGERAEPCAAAALAFVILGLTSRRGSRLDGGGATAGALVCLALMVALFRVEPLLALPYGVAAFGLGLSARGGHPGLTALLTLPGPLYLTSGDVWRELRFHGLAPDALAPWGLFVTVVWLPVACWSHDWRGAIRGERVALVVVGVVALVWAWLTPAFSAAMPELTGR
ncbi:M28 family metallopeptidase, partial [Myxococcota bacterium]|nr:M28 family metallopeptidase [Myxococcota bacterium]